MKWREIPLPARRYILYHVIVSPLLITWYMLPLYMFMTGYNVLDVGLLFTIVHIASIPLTYLFGKLFEKIPLRHGLVAIDALDGVAYVLYGLAYGPIAPTMLFLGLLVEELSGMLYPLYPAVEKLLYPKDRLEEVFAWHMRLPEASQLIGFLILGYVFGYLFNTPLYYRIGFLLFGLLSIFMVYYIIKFLPRMDAYERIRVSSFRFRVDREFKFIVFIEVLTIVAWSLAPEIVLLNYIVNVLGYTLFEAMVVEAAISVGAILATYVTERIGVEKRFIAIGFGYGFIALWALIMMAAPSIEFVVLAYFIMKFGDTLAFPFYRGWLFSKVPEDKASTVFSAISSLRRMLTLFTPAVAGALAYINPVLPYTLSLILFTIVFVLMLLYKYWSRHVIE